jgi:hypothetical protein
MLLRVDDVHRQPPSEILEPFLGNAVDMDFEVSAGKPHSDRLREAPVPDITDYRELGGPVPDQISDVPGSKGSSAAQQVNGFE